MDLFSNPLHGNNRGFAKFGLFRSDSLSDCSNVQIKIMFLFQNTKFKGTYSLFGTCTEDIVAMLYC